jgi:hypothetical protein
MTHVSTWSTVSRVVQENPATGMASTKCDGAMVRSRSWRTEECHRDIHSSHTRSN